MQFAVPYKLHVCSWGPDTVAYKSVSNLCLFQTRPIILFHRPCSNLYINTCKRHAIFDLSPKAMGQILQPWLEHCLQFSWWLFWLSQDCRICPSVIWITVEVSYFVPFAVAVYAVKSTSRHPGWKREVFLPPSLWYSAHLLIMKQD